ncbi:T9SS type A sorting domain-containing protein [Flavobacterium sp. SM15]|uniref:choice-of-anchor tandem repeat GloVer-containing protein n=1 Tax=Flavobacterium sp. SM15 TaxID=2908005 RepID=UPI001EDC686B|nr:choice-of-anchor tandem repeat GloVer-containing protein [Flavobacterium sp. SM15]MCG2610649.1 T9SS type A sorting domain-containing protein [Flavobacterium sp. SM15]
MRKILLCIGILLTTISTNAQFTNLHNFSAVGSGGYSSLTSANGHLYGTTNIGGANNAGYVYSLNPNGIGITILHNFTETYSFPCGSLLYNNGVLYGMTSNGTIYKINADGSDYSILHSFTYQNPNDGNNPQGSLVISGNILYGMTRKGGAVYADLLGGLGTIFKINTDGSNFSLLHSFALGEENPYGSLLLDGNFLYGMTSTYGSNDNAGKIFKINKDGTGYTILHTFNYADGAKPNGTLVLGGNTLYGMTALGGNTGNGVRKGNVFKINTDGTGFQSIFNDLNGSQYYTWSYGSLVLVGNVLYGKSNVNLYSINTDGTGYQWYNWGQYGTAPESYDIQENGTLTYDGSALYGVNNRYGGTLDRGVIYKFTPANLSINSNSLASSSIKIYPNPATEHITIDCGNQTNVNGWNVKIINTLGQEVFSQSLNQQESTVSLNTLSGTGIYLVKIYNDSNKLIDTQKIILK